MSTTDFADIDLFRDPDLPQDPYAYYDWVREQGPVWYYPKWDVWLITGYEEATAVYHDQATWSNCNTVSGPFVKIPVPLEGDDISEIIEAYRDDLPFSDQLPSFDPPKHTDQRGLLMRLITPKRLKENEAFMWEFADQTIDEFYERGECEFIPEYALPFTLMVVADLLGVPAEDRDEIRAKLAGKERPMAKFRASLVQDGGGPATAGAQAARVPLRAVHGVHRGPSARAARRHHDGDGPGHIPRRHAATGRRRDEDLGKPVLRGR